MLYSGNDLIYMPRLERAVLAYGDKFVSRIFTPTEIQHCKGRVPQLAVRFAAKEAIAKALGVGMRIMSRHGIAWHEAEVINDAKGKPIVMLHGHAEQLARELNIAYWSLSLSHDHEYAIAMAVALGK